MKNIALVVSALLTLFPASAEAYDWFVVAHVTETETTYIPTILPFHVDVGGGTCSAGSALAWNIHGTNDTQKAQNVQAALAMLMTAQVTGHTVNIFGNNNGCTVDYVSMN